MKRVILNEVKDLEQFQNCLSDVAKLAKSFDHHSRKSWRLSLLKTNVENALAHSVRFFATLRMTATYINPCKMLGSAASRTLLSYGVVSRKIRPRVPSTRTRLPLVSLLRHPRTDMTAGICISRAVTAPCDSGPPLSVMTAAAV